VQDLPEAWNAKMEEDLGLTPPDHRLGVMQDVHWAAGYFGYFPTYTLGNLYAAQFFAKAAQELGDLEAGFARDPRVHPCSRSPAPFVPPRAVAPDAQDSLRYAVFPASLLLPDDNRGRGSSGQKQKPRWR